MNIEVILELLKYILPALIVFFTAYFTIRSLLKHDQRKRDYEIIMKNKQVVTPIRLQAYERLTLLLERISPDSLVMRVSNKENLTVQQMQNQMLATIRSEFDHNVSQQIYITPKAWEVVKNARENVVKLINTTAQELKPDDKAMKFSRALLEKVMEQERSPAKVAIDYLKQEIRSFY